MLSEKLLAYTTSLVCCESVERMPRSGVAANMAKLPSRCCTDLYRHQQWI